MIGLSDLQAATVVPLVLGVILFLYSLIAIGRVAMQKYGLRLVLSLSFALVLSSVVFAGLGAYTIYGDTGLQMQMSQAGFANSFIYLGSSAACVLIAATHNIGKSNGWFGTLFTFVQILLAISIAAIAVWLFTRKFRRRFAYLQTSLR